MPRDLLAEPAYQPRDLFAEPASDGVAGRVGDWIMDNAIGGVSADMLERARSGEFSQDAANDSGFLDRATSLFERGGASFDQGIYAFLGGLGSEKARQAAATLEQGTTSQPVAGSTGWQDVTDASSLGRYVVDAGAESLPSMAALAVPVAGVGLLAGSQTGNIASDRAANNNSGDVTPTDLLAASPAALASVALDRIGFKGIVNPVGGTVAGRIGGAAVREGLTESAQSGIEYAGGSLGTDAGFDPATAVDQAIAGGVAGFGIGGAARGAGEVARPATQAIRSRTRTEAPAGDTAVPDEWEGSLDDLMRGEQEPRDLLALPSPEMVRREVAVDTPSAAPVRREEPVEDGGAIVRSIFGDQARVTSTYRGPDHPLSKANPRSYHTRTNAAVDIAPIEGMTFDQAKQSIEAQGYTLIEAIDETGDGRTAHATGDHWHFVIGNGDGTSAPVDTQPVDVPMPEQEAEQPSIAAGIELPEGSGQDWRLPQGDNETRTALPDAPETEQQQEAEAQTPTSEATQRPNLQTVQTEAEVDRFLAPGNRPLADFGDTLYRETNVGGALYLIPESGWTDGSPFGDEVFLANNRDLALGQGGNTGVVLEFEPGELQGQFNRNKPGAEQVARQSRQAEVRFIGRKAQLKQNIRAVTITPQAQGSKSEKEAMRRTIQRMERAGWMRTNGPDGSIRLERQQSSTNQPQPATVAPDEQAAQPAGQTAPAPDAVGSGQDRGADGSVPRLARGQLRGLGIARELQSRQSAALVGRPVNSPQELAEIAQIYRDPRYETFRLFLTKGNEIVHATGVSSRSIAEAPFLPEGMETGAFFEDVKQTMQRSGADGFYMLHNHPSGEPNPSPADKQLTRAFAQRLPGFKGHVVINSNKYAYISASGQSMVNDIGGGNDTILSPSVPHKLFGNKITNDMHMVMLAKELQKPGWVTVMGTDARGKLRVIVEYPSADLKRDEKTLAAMARRIQRQSGSARLFLVGEKDALDTPVVKRALRDGIVTRAIDENGRPIEQFKSGKKRKLPQAPGRYVAEGNIQFGGGEGDKDGLIDKLVDRDGLTRDAEAIRKAVGNPVQTLKAITKGSFADIYRSFFYSMDARTRQYAKRFNAPSITKLADMFHAEAGKTDKATGETYHEAVEREGFGRASQAWRILEPYFNDKAAMDRIGLMLRDPARRQTGARKAEAQAAAKIAKLLKDTIDYRKAAGEDIGEVTDGYFPRWMDVEKVMKQRDLFLKQATELYRKHGAENPQAKAEAWLARIFDQYAGLDGGIAYAGLFRDTRPAGVGRKTSKEREFGKDADKLLGAFYNNDTGEVLTSYFIGASRKAEEARRFGGDKLERLMNDIKREMRNSDEDAGDVLDDLANIIDTNLGRVTALSEKKRAAASVLHTAGQLGTLDRATITSLSEAMMGFVRAGPRYGIPMLKNSVKEFARQISGGNPSDAARLAEALGIIEDVMVGDTLAARAGFERSQTTTRAAKVQRGFFRATGLHQWTEGTRTAATQMGQAFIRNNAEDVMGRNPKRAEEALRELGISDPKAFAEWLAQGGNPSVESLTAADASKMHREYRTALMRFVNQTIMKPTRAQKPRWASTPYGALVFSLMSFSYGFKKNVLDRTGRMTQKAWAEKDPSLLYPALGLAGLLAAHTVINNVLRQAIFGGGREDDEEGIDWVDVLEAVDRAGLTAAASRPLNAAFSLRYRQGIIESMMGPVIGRPADLLEKAWTLAFNNSENTNTAERAAAGAIYDVVLEPALEAYGVSRLRGGAAAGTVWLTGNREGGALPPDRDFFVDAIAGPKEN